MQLRPMRRACGASRCAAVEAASKLVRRVDAELLHALVLHHVVHARDRQPFPDPRRVVGRAALDVVHQLCVAPPRAARHLVHAELELVVLQPVRLAQQRVEHRRLVDVREHDAEVRPQLPVRSRRAGTPRRARWPAAAGAGGPSATARRAWPCAGSPASCCPASRTAAAPRGADPARACPRCTSIARATAASISGRLSVRERSGSGFRVRGSGEATGTLVAGWMLLFTLH